MKRKAVGSGEENAWACVWTRGASLAGGVWVSLPRLNLKYSTSPTTIVATSSTHAPPIRAFFHSAMPTAERHRDTHTRTDGQWRENIRHVQLNTVAFSSVQGVDEVTSLRAREVLGSYYLPKLCKKKKKSEQVRPVTFHVFQWASPSLYTLFYGCFPPD